MCLDKSLLCWVYVLAVFLLASLTKSNGQTLTLDTVTYMTPCTSALRHSKDRVIFSGTARTSGTDGNTWPRNIAFQMENGSGAFENVCRIELSSSSGNKSDCYVVSSLKDVFKVAGNLTSMFNYSQSLARLQWRHRDAVTSVASNTIRIREVYDWNAYFPEANVSTQKGKWQLKIKSNQCQIQAGDLNNMTLCCFKIRTPCWAHIYMNDSVVSSGHPCANYTVIPSNTGFPVKVNFRISDCIGDDYITSWECLVEGGHKDHQETSSRDAFLSTIMLWITSILAVTFCLRVGMLEGLKDE